MSHTPNELHDEFPDLADQFHALKVNNAHFAKLYGEYHDLNRAIHRAETDIEPTDDANLETMKKQRLALKDAIIGMTSK